MSHSGQHVFLIEFFLRVVLQRKLESRYKSRAVACPVTAASKALRVVDFSVDESISMPYRIKLTLASKENVDFDDVVGNEALLTILDDKESSYRYFHGILEKFEVTGTSSQFFLYDASVVPNISLLRLKQNYRIFQEKTTQDIVTQVLKDAGVPADQFKFNLSGSYEPREYCVQYRETDLDFISRLIFEEGIFYFFEHSKDKHLLIFGDDSSCHKPIAGKPEVVYNFSGGMPEEEEFIDDFSFFKQIRTGKITYRDFNYEKPSLDLTADEEDKENKDLEVYDYPGPYMETDPGKKLAKVNLEKSAMAKENGDGTSNCARLIAGFKFTLKDYPEKKLNQEYVLTTVTHVGEQSQVFDEISSDGGFSYSNNFLCAPSSAPLRPPRVQKPIVRGIQTAFVVGPSGEEIYTDEHGRIKVQFHWDREGKNDEKSSCWIRVSQAWAGVQWGAMFIPRIGHEVIIDFIDGDPDRPIVTGCVYNATNVPPYKLPDKKTVSTVKTYSSPGGDGFNEIRFEDKKDEEEIFVHAQKDQNEIVENDLSREVKNNQTLIVGMNRTATVLEENDTLTIKKGDRMVEVTEGKELLTVKKGTRTVEVKDGETHTNQADYTHEVKGDFTLKVSGAITIEAGGTMTLKASKININ